ncbi:hypothetical protein V5799_003194 [Amblyomma americanum]|uniref:Acyltransferase n=1 Tax=Amblyomma americanum TaxID=6943 RepID=A0AAQ4D9N9_AMBAM
MRKSYAKSRNVPRRIAGLLCEFLSWDAFVPLSRLSFGVYLVHSPFFLLTFHISRERIYFSHFFIVTLFFSALVWCFSLSYLLFIACEAPVSRLDKLIFAPRANAARSQECGNRMPASNAKQRSSALPNNVDSVCCESGFAQGEDIEKSKVLIIINGETVCYHL